MSPRPHITRPRRSSPPTRLVAYLDQEDNWRGRKSVPLPEICCEKRLQKTKNSVQRSKDNNDLLEFIGDRVINLACSLMVDKIKTSSEHHKVVGRALCNNDTVGRLAYQCGLHKKAIFNYHDDNEVKSWDPRHSLAPPKALADLFEAYVGALYEEHGWDTVMAWLAALYKPLVEVATEDFLQRSSDPARPLPESKSTELLPAEVFIYQARLLDYLNFKGPTLVESGQVALDALPPATQFFFSLDGSLANDSDRAELATHLINFWICEIFMRVYPQLLQATYKGAHLITWITRLVTTEETIGYLGSLLSLSSFFDSRDVDHNSSRQLLLRPRNVDSPTTPCESSYRNKFALALKATIGWYYLHDSSSAEKWGEDWFKFIVIRTHDIIAEDPSYQPSVPESARDTLAVHAAAMAASDSQSKLASTSLADLTRDLENISISQDSDSQDPPLLANLESDAIPDSIVLDSRINEESLSKFRPLANISSQPKRHSRPDVESQPIDKLASPKKEDEPKKADVSRKLSLSTEDPTKDDSESSSPMEQSLITAFKGIQISSLNTTVKTVESNRGQPKVIIKPETSSRLASGPTESTLATQHPAPSASTKTMTEHSKWKAVGAKV